jgi:hypothetical protein
VELENISQMEYLFILEKGSYLRNIISSFLCTFYVISFHFWEALRYSFIQRYNELTFLVCISRLISGVKSGANFSLKAYCKLVKRG